MKQPALRSSPVPPSVPPLSPAAAAVAVPKRPPTPGLLSRLVLSTSTVESCARCEPPPSGFPIAGRRPPPPIRSLPRAVLAKPRDTLRRLLFCSKRCVTARYDDAPASCAAPEPSRWPPHRSIRRAVALDARHRCHQSPRARSPKFICHQREAIGRPGKKRLGKAAPPDRREDETTRLGRNARARCGPR